MGDDDDDDDENKHEHSYADTGTVVIAKVYILITMTSFLLIRVPFPTSARYSHLSESMMPCASSNKFSFQVRVLYL